MDFKLWYLIFCLVSLIRGSGRGAEKSPQVLEGPRNAISQAPWSSFEAKHLFNNGHNIDTKGNKIIPNSFSDLSKGGERLKQYLTNLNSKLVRGRILPPKDRSEFNSWLDNVQKNGRIVTIVDANIDSITESVKTEFTKHKNAIEKAINMRGKKPGKHGISDSFFENAKNWLDKRNNLNKRNKIYEEYFKSPAHLSKTDERFTVTEIIYKVEGKGNDRKLTFTLEQKSGKLELGTDFNGNPSHFHSTKDVDSKSVKTHHTQAKFSYKELQENARRAENTWKKAKPGTRVLNDEVPDFKNAHKMPESEISDETQTVKTKDTSSNVDGCSRRSKRSTIAGMCGFKFQAHGEIDSINAKEFMDSYSRATKDDRTKLAETARAHKDKIVTGGGSNDFYNEKMLEILKIEQENSHITAVKAAEQVNDITKTHDIAQDKTNRPSQIMQDIETTIKPIRFKVKLSSTALGKALSAAALSSTGKGFSKGTSKVSNALSTFLVTKTIVNGIIHQDKTALAIVGGQLGFEIATSTGEWLAQASKMGKTSKFLGKVAGPMGTAIDIGLTTYSLVKSVQRLKNATNKYEKNEAIADIVSDSVDIAITATVTVLSYSFPPAAPLIAAVGIVLSFANQFLTSLFKTANEVNRINSEIKLLGFEKREVFHSRIFDWFGTRKPDYIDSLLQEKTANDIAVEHSLKFLEQNENFLGLVFPSRTLKYDGSCHLTSRHCALKNAWGCTRWERESTIEKGCDFRKPCYGSEICDNYKTHQKGLSYDQRKCYCDGDPKTTFGYPRSNSLVDLRHPGQVYWERSVPSDVKSAVFLCKPGSKNFVDYKVSQEHPRPSEYLCENAIGLLQPASKRRPGQIIMFDLEDGNDVVRCSRESTTPYLFRMGNGGEKQFYGGNDRNDFLFDSKCTSKLTGVFYGGNHDDAITIDSQCASGDRITVNFREKKIFSSAKSIDMMFNSVEQVLGRKNEGDTFVAACSTTKIMGRGGSNKLNDTISIPYLPSCKYNITVLVGNNTNIDLNAHSGIYSLLIDSQWNRSEIRANIRQMEQHQLDIVFLDTMSSDIERVKIKVLKESILDLVLKRSAFDVLLEDKNQTILFKFNLFDGKFETRIGFMEDFNNTIFSSLILPQTGSAVFYHLLSGASGLKRKGCKSVANVFEITDSEWTVVGGDKSDNFIIYNDKFHQIDGGAGVDTLTLHKSFTNKLSVNLSTTRFKNIENVYGVTGIPLTVYTSCLTNIVASGGGSSTEYDEIHVPMLSCTTGRNTQIVSVGKTKIWLYPSENRMEQNLDNEQVSIFIDTTFNNTTDVLLNINSRANVHSGTSIVINTVYYDWDIKILEQDASKNLLNIQMNGSSNPDHVTNETVTVRLEGEQNAIHVSPPSIHILFKESDPGFLEITDDTLSTKLIFVDNNKPEMFFKGLKNIRNEFYVNASQSSWTILGGNLNDVVIVKAATLNLINPGHYVVDGNGGTDNVLVLETEENDVDNCFEVNLVDKYFGYIACNDSAHRHQQGRVKNIQHLFGQISVNDRLVSNCNTKTIDGRGGKGPGIAMDHVIIPNANCFPNLAVQVGQYTAVSNLARKGKFMYSMNNLNTSLISLLSTSDNQHEISFQINSWEEIHGIAFDSSSKSLGFKAKFGNSTKIHAFPMYKPPNHNVYTNPVFSFAMPGSTVTSIVEVSIDEVILATYLVGSLNDTEMVKGLPVDVNRFLINITSGEGGQIQGCVDGNRCSANQFWIFDLRKPLQLLDGGKCSTDGCINSLHFAKSFSKYAAHVHLDEYSGFVKSGNEENLITQLRNIHQFHGTGTESVHVACNTTQLTGVKNVVIPSRLDCFPELVVEVSRNTKVVFNQPDIDYSENQVVSLSGSIHYRFTEAMSFEPDGDYFDLIYFDHFYYLPFSLNSIQNLHFDKENSTLAYTVKGMEHTFHIFSDPDLLEQFYPQPSILTNDDYNLQVARDGSIWATLGNASAEVDIDSVPALQATASKLGITIVLRSLKEFYYIGHSNSSEDRNVLGNMLGTISHLGGGGANRTIYEITDLTNDVYIHTGFTEDEDDKTDINEEMKQTIDLTDLVVPLRAKLGTKYVPSLKATKSNLEIIFEGHTDEFPGKVIIVDGIYIWVQNRIQLLLNNAMMDIVLLENDHKSDDRLQKRGTDETRKNHSWKIIPRKLTIPETLAVFSVAMEDLEDNQVIQTETNHMNNIASRMLTSDKMNFKAAQNNTDLFLTNALSNGFQELQTILILDFFQKETVSLVNTTQGGSKTPELDSEADTLEILKLPKTIRNISINLPGLAVVLNDTDLMAKNNNGDMVPVEILELKKEFDIKEQQLNPGSIEIEKNKTTTILFIVLGVISVIALLPFLVWIIYAFCKYKQDSYSVASKQLADSNATASETIQLQDINDQ